MSATASGRRTIVLLFIALAVATAVSLLGFAQLVPPENRTRVYIALAGNLLLAALAIPIFIAMNRRRAET